MPQGRQILPTYKPPRDVIRWQAVRNRSKKIIPGWSLVSLSENDAAQSKSGAYNLVPSSQRGKYFSGARVDQQNVWNVYQPDDAAEARQDPAMLMVTGPTPIPIGDEGKATQDWPAMVLHDGGKDSLPNGAKCGPKAGSFYVWSTGTAFSCLGHDPTDAAGRGKIHTCFISASREPSIGLWLGSGSAAPLSANARISLLELESKGPIKQVGSQIETGFDGYVFVAVSATLTSSIAPEGTILALRLQLNDSGTRLMGYRTMCIEDDSTYQTAFRTSENVAFSGLIGCAKGDKFSIDSETSTTLNVTALCISFHKVYEFVPRGASDGFSYTP